MRERWRWQFSVLSDLDPVCARENICSAEFGEGERQQVGVLEGRAAREPASIVFCFRWVSPHREGTDSMRFVGPCPWSESSGARTTEVVSRHLCLLWIFYRRITKIGDVKTRSTTTEYIPRAGPTWLIFTVLACFDTGIPCSHQTPHHAPMIPQTAHPGRSPYHRLCWALARCQR